MHALAAVAVGAWAVHAEREEPSDQGVPIAAYRTRGLSPCERNREGQACV